MNATRIIMTPSIAPGRIGRLRGTRLVPTLLLVFALGASTCTGISAHAQTLAAASQPQPVQPEFGEMNGHVFLRDTQGTVDVTSTVQTVNGQTYATLHGQTIAININNANGTVTDGSGNAIGYRVQAQ